MQSRGNKFLNHSKCGYCKKTNKTVKPYGHMSDKGYLSLKGSCASCSHTKSLPYTKTQLDVEGSGIKSFFKGVYNKVIKPLGKEAIKNISKDPMKALQTSIALGSAIGSKNPQMIMKAGINSGKFLTTGGAVKIGELTNGTGLYLYKK